MTTQTMEPSDFIPVEKQKTFFGHPAGLFILFFTEMWERFSYYGMRALLVLYMTRYLISDPERASRVLGFETLHRLLEIGFGPLATQPLASQLYGLYTGFVYLSPFFGGIIADKVWGQRRTVYVGAIIMAIGHFLMASEAMFLPALLCLIIGNGAFKPNISTQVGNLYPAGDPRRDGAFTIFYMGVNLGAFFSPLVCGTLGQSKNWGWHWGFGAAGVGMIIGLAVYHFGRHLLPIDKHMEKKSDQLAAFSDELIAPESNSKAMLFKTVFGFFAAMIIFFIILVIPAILKLLVILAVIGGISFTISKLKPEERSRVIALCLMSLGAVAFWAIYEQQGNSMELWADEQTIWPVIMGFQIPSTWFQSFNPFMIFLFAPFLDMWWNSQAKKGKGSTSIRKMGLGCILTGCSFIVMILCVKVTGVGMKSGLGWITIMTWMLTIGELYLSPIGMSVVTKVAPKNMLSMMMGVFLAASFLGNYLSGYLGSFYNTMPKENFFLMLTVIGVAVGFLFLASEKQLKKAMGDV